MIYALNLEGEKIEATPNTKAICPICKQKVISRCGEINIWHFAHKNNEDCDNWSEGETLWHREWKEQFKKEEREVIVGKHRADIKINNLIIELQSTSISPAEIREREEFYKTMVWIFNETKNKNIYIRKNKEEMINGELIITPYKNNFCTFRWKHPKKTLWECKRRIYLDLGNNEILQINKIYHDKRCAGSGWTITKENLILEISKERW